MALENFGVNESLPEGLASDGQTIYMVGQANKTLYRINPVTAEGSPIGNISNFGTGESKPTGLAFHKNELYMVGRTGKCLYKVSISTGRAKKVGKQTNFGGMENKPQGLASNGEILYMTGAQNNVLYSVEVEGSDAGKAKKIGSFESGDNEPHGLTYHKDEKQLYMIGGEHNNLYKVNINSGTLERVEHPEGLGVEERKLTGITYYNNKIHFVGQQQNRLYAIDENNSGFPVGSEIIRTGGMRDIGRPIDDPPGSTQVTPQSGGQSRLLFAEQSEYWTPISDPDDFYKYIPIVTSIGLTNQTATIPIEFLKGTASANKQQQGGFAYSGGFGIGASVEGTQLFFKGITGAKTMGTSGTDITYTKSAKNTASNFSATATIDLTSCGSHSLPRITLTSGKPVLPQRLWIILPTTGITTGVAEITGQDYHGQTIKERFTIRNLGLRRAIPTKSYFRPYVTSGDQSTLDTLSERPDLDTPLKLSTYSETAITISSSGIAGASSIEIKTYDESQTVTFNLNDNNGFRGWTVEAQKGGDVCHTYIGVVPVSFTTSLSRDQALTYDFECLAYDMKQYQNAEGLDTKEKNNNNQYPNTSSIIAPRSTASASPSPRPSAGMDIRSGAFRQDPQGDPNTWDKTGRTDIDPQFYQASQELFTGWQSQLSITNPLTGETSTIPLLDATFTINQTIEQAMVIMGERNPGPYYRSGLREVTLSGNMLLTRERDWITEFEDNSEFLNSELLLLNVTTGGFPYQTTFKFGRGQLTTAPDASVDGLGLISVPFNMAFFQDQGGVADDFKIYSIYHQNDWFGGQEEDKYRDTQNNGGLDPTK